MEKSDESDQPWEYQRSKNAKVKSPKLSVGVVDNVGMRQTFLPADIKGLDGERRRTYPVDIKQTCKRRKNFESKSESINKAEFRLIVQSGREKDKKFEAKEEYALNGFMHNIMCKWLPLATQQAEAIANSNCGP